MAEALWNRRARCVSVALGSALAKNFTLRHEEVRAEVKRLEMVEDEGTGGVGTQSEGDGRKLSWGPPRRRWKEVGRAALPDLPSER
mmetsp:Transcript_3892/g.10698  ORF Transcript_3892/g.10698 Transcript_3892/m.10698 type:complete len:86 (-) Transcript_3892:284-541(-)